MSEINIQPLPTSMRAVPPELWPACPPVKITCPEDRELAFALYEALDEQSRRWYATRCSLFADA